MKTICPICASQALKRVGDTVSCQCGWYKSFNKVHSSRLQSKVVKNLFIAGFMLMGVVFYVNQWGSHSLSIMPLKARQWTGLLNQDSYKKLQSICMQLKKYNCVESVHYSYFRSSKDLQALHSLGELQYRRGAFNKAGDTYKMYFNKEGRGVKPAYNYARILEKLGHNKHALKYYKYALSADKKIVQVSVMRAYINLLVKQGFKSKAAKELKAFKKLVKRSTAYVQQEYKNLKTS